MIGATLGSYTIQRELGRGGMGAVFVGVHTLLGRTAAIKVLLPELSRNQEIVQRFFNEARAATAIKHPGIVEIFDFGYTAEGQAYIVMEFLEGESLSTRLQKFGRLSPAFALAVTRQCAGALAVAHRAGIVHRDLKPDNVFLVPDPEVAMGERIKLLDFGIAKLATEGVGSMARTSTGAIMGTPYYMSPEQCRGAGHVDARSDLYALGCMLFEMLCGRVPFVGEGAGEIIAAHIHVPPPSLRALAPDVPEAVELLIGQLLAKPVEQRLQSADALAQEIARLMQQIGVMITNPGGGGGMHASAGAASSASFAGYGAVPMMSTGGSPTTLGSAVGQASQVSAAPKPRRLGLVVGVVAFVVLAAGALALVATRDDRPRGQPSAAASPDAGAAKPPIDASAVAVNVDAGAAVAASVDATIDQELTGEAARLIGEARKAVVAEEWDAAARAARGVLALDSSSVEAETIAKLADLEGPAAALATIVTDSLAGDDFEAALAAFASIPADSRYKARAAPAMDDLRTLYFEEVTPELEALVKRGKCKEAAVVADEASDLWPTEAAALKKKAANCKKPTAKVSPDAGVPVVPPPPEDDDPERGGVRELIDEGAALVMDGKYEAALKLFDKALKLQPGNGKARFNAAVAAFQLGDCKRTLRYLQGVRNPKAKKLREKCAEPDDGY